MADKAEKPKRPIRPKLEWLPITEKVVEEKKGIVLCANFKPHTYGYKEKMAGWLVSDIDGIYSCEYFDEVLENCTHYIDINAIEEPKG